MRGIVAALMLALGCLTAIAPATLAKAVTSTETFNTQGLECTVHPDPYFSVQYCIDGKSVFHTTLREDGGYNVVYYTDYTYQSTGSGYGCTSEGEGDITQHSQSTGKDSYDDSDPQVTHQLAVGEYSYRINCPTYAVDAHCVYDVFFHFADDRLQFSDHTFECTYQPLE